MPSTPTDDLARERALFTEGPVIVFRWRAVAGWPVEYVSPNVSQLFGWSSDDLMSGRVPYGSTVHPEDLSRVAEEVAGHSASGVNHFEQDYRIVAKDGGTRWLYDQTRVLRDDAGEVTHYLGYVLDVTGRRTAELALANARRVESLGRLAGGVAHDFNNLLTALAGHLDLALGKLEPDHPARTSLGVARRTVDRGAALTGQLLAVARHDRSAPRPVAVDAAVRDTLDLLGPLLGDDVVIETELNARRGIAAVDPIQLQQVLMNLALNARDAMPDGGRLRFVTEDVGDEVVVRVIDEGVGMDPATAARAFEPFFSTREGGTGLGLASVAAIVEQNEGRLSLRTEPNQGTTVEVALPAAAGTPTPPSAAPSRRARSARILVVEDNAEIRDLFVEVLNAHGHDVRSAAGGDSAIGMAEAFAPELLLTDVSMPGTGGVSLVSALEERGWHGPVLFVSGHVRNLELPWGPDRILLRKPFGVDTLLDNVARLLPA